MAPVVDRLKKEFSGQVDFRILNVDEKENDDEAAKYGVQYIPTFIFLDKNGKQVDKVVGGIPEEELRKKIENLVR
jgi:thiol-disulfide isomerase/thioredoxin